MALMSIASAPVSFLVSWTVSLVRSTEAITPAAELLMRLMIVESESVVVLYAMSVPLIVSFPVVVDVRPVKPALSSAPSVRATPRFAALVAVALAMPNMPRALLASLAAPNESECG